jgi:GxxExxY protein
MEGAGSVGSRGALWDLSERVLGCAIEVHRELGPGLLENVYRQCLARELQSAGLAVRQEVAIPVQYKTLLFECGFRADLVVEDLVLLELKAVDQLLPVHEAQVLSYLRFSGLHLGLLLNFHARPLRNGIRRLVN